MRPTPPHSEYERSDSPFTLAVQAANAASTALFTERKRRRLATDEARLRGAHVSLSLGGDEDGDDPTTALVKAVAKATGATVPALPDAFSPSDSRRSRELVTWAGVAIADAQVKAAVNARRERYRHALSPDDSIEAMRLVARLNELLG